MLLQSVCGAKRDPSVQTFGDLLQCVLNTACTRARQAGCGVVYLVFDSYREDDLGGGGGLKNNTWKRRHGGEHLPVYSGITLRDKVPTGRKDGMSVFLRVASNKRQLIALFRDNFCSFAAAYALSPIADVCCGQPGGVHVHGAGGEVGDGALPSRRQHLL